MTADSPTPGTEVCSKPCSDCPAWQECPSFRPAAPSPVGTTEPPAETQDFHPVGSRPCCAFPAETQRDGREPQPCPKCGQLCTYDGWSHVHRNGFGIGSCNIEEPPAEAQQDDERAQIELLLIRNGVWPLAVAERCATALAARPSADTETLRDALRLIAGPAPHCAASTTERHACRQPGSGRTRGARYGADAWCDQCIARAALDGR